jgi:hypothetical protein
MNSKGLKLMKRKKAEENADGTRNGVVDTVTDIFVSSVESEKEIDHEIGDSVASCH